MSVEGVPGIFCLSSGPICMANISRGTCPGPQYGLTNGAYCGVVKSGVYGCKPNGSAPSSTPSVSPAPAATTATPAKTTAAPVPVATTAAPAVVTGKCTSGFEMSVEGVPGIFCVATGPICLANNGSGTCPGPQAGLPNGAYCGTVKSGVFGCKPNASGSATAPPATTISPPATTTAPPATTTAPPATTTLAPVPSTMAPTTSAPLTITLGKVCGAGATPMSTEGVAPIFCVAEPACVQQHTTGNCPGPQEGLPFGSTCGLITKTGVYCCKPNSKPAARSLRNML